MIYSGLDWSGSPGREAHAPFLVFAIVHCVGDDLPRLESKLSMARKVLRLPPDYVFKHLGASRPVQDHVFAILRRLRLRAHVHIIEKSTWTDEYVRRSSGPDRICDGMVALVLGCPDVLVANQRLFVDLPRDEMKLIRDQRTAIGQALRGAGRKSFGNVQPRPDHRQHGSIIQIADTIAGEVHEQRGLTGPYLPWFGSRIKLV
jgi:hypothetical protein